MCMYELFVFSVLRLDILEQKYKLAKFRGKIFGAALLRAEVKRSATCDYHSSFLASISVVRHGTRVQT